MRNLRNCSIVEQRKGKLAKRARRINESYINEMSGDTEMYIEDIYDNLEYDPEEKCIYCHNLMAEYKNGYIEFDKNFTKDMYVKSLFLSILIDKYPEFEEYV